MVFSVDVAAAVRAVPTTADISGARRGRPRERRPREQPPRCGDRRCGGSSGRCGRRRAAGSRPANGVPAGINDARPLGSDAACVSRSAGSVAGAAAVLSGAAAPGSAAGGCGRVIDAVAAAAVLPVWPPPGGGGVQQRREALHELCRGRRIGCELLDERKTRHARARGGRRCRCAGWAAAVPLSATAAVTAPAAAIIVVANSFPVMCMVLPFRLSARLGPKLRSYWCYSSDTCGIYSTVTDAKGIRDRSIESDG